MISVSYKPVLSMARLPFFCKEVNIFSVFECFTGEFI